MTELELFKLALEQRDLQRLEELRRNAKEIAQRFAFHQYDDMRCAVMLTAALTAYIAALEGSNPGRIRYP